MHRGERQVAAGGPHGPLLAGVGRAELKRGGAPRVGFRAELGVVSCRAGAGAPVAHATTSPAIMCFVQPLGGSRCGSGRQPLSSVVLAVVGGQAAARLLEAAPVVAARVVAGVQQAAAHGRILAAHAQHRPPVVVLQGSRARRGGGWSMGGSARGLGVVEEQLAHETTETARNSPRSSRHAAGRGRPSPPRQSSSGCGGGGHPVGSTTNGGGLACGCVDVFARQKVGTVSMPGCAPSTIAQRPRQPAGSRRLTP